MKFKVIYPCGLDLGGVGIAQDWGRETAEEYVEKINKAHEAWLKINSAR